MCDDKSELTFCEPGLYFVCYGQRHFFSLLLPQSELSIQRIISP